MTLNVFTDHEREKGELPVVDQKPQGVQRAPAPELSYYAHLVTNDMLKLVEDLLKRGGYRLRWGDGRLTADFTQVPQTPWHYVRVAKKLDCYLWHSIYFNIVSTKTEKRFVPSKCQQCFKTVVRPKTLTGLFSLLEIQKNLTIPCKLGIEVRPTVCGLYGGYHYAIGLEEGLQQYRIVREAVNDMPHLGPDTMVLLKRSCTEFELACGSSENWQVTQKQLDLEEKIEQILDHTPNNQNMPDHVIANVHRRWIEWAWECGDETYKEFTGGSPLYRPYTTYHHLLEDLPRLVKGRWHYNGKTYGARERLPKKAREALELAEKVAPPKVDLKP